MVPRGTPCRTWPLCGLHDAGHFLHGAQMTGARHRSIPRDPTNANPLNHRQCLLAVRRIPGRRHVVRLRVHRHVLQFSWSRPDPQLPVPRPVRSRSRPGCCGVKYRPAVRKSWAAEGVGEGERIAGLRAKAADRKPYGKGRIPTRRLPLWASKEKPRCPRDS